VNADTGPETAGEHLAEARRLAARAEDADSNWDRSVDLQAAQVHASIAQTLEAAKAVPLLAALAAYLDPPVAAENSSSEEAGDDG
jgi:hypothetical protein